MFDGSFYVFLCRRWWAAFLLLGLSFLLFGLASLNVIHVVMASSEFLLTFGVDAIRDGVLIQLVEVIMSRYLAAVFYVLFKVCEKVLVERVAGRKGN